MATDQTTAAIPPSIYEQLESYPWNSDKEFQGGLSAILGPNPSPSQLEDLTLRAQCFYLSRKKSIPIDFNAYKTYLSLKKQASSSSDTTTSSTSRPTSTLAATSTPSNATPTSPAQDSHSAAMAVSSTPADPSSFASAADIPIGIGAPNPNPNPNTNTSTGAPYPASFAEIVAMIQAGKEIPGYIEVSERVLGWEKSSPAVLPKRRKPWEQDVPEEIIQGRGPGCFGDDRDLPEIKQEYPEGV